LPAFAVLPAAAAAAPGDVDPASALAAVLRYVDNRGMVDYSGLKQEPGLLRDFAKAVAQFPEPRLLELPEADRIAFWINAYNGLTLKAVVDHYPIQPSFLTSLVYPRNSIRQISGVWDRLQFEVAARHRTLDEIEHEILRKEFDEPGIHVALVCAARSCPPLRNEPYQGSRLQDQLADQVRRLLADPKSFRIDPDSGTVYLSRIFEWYGSDFIPRFGTAEPGRHSDAEEAVLNYLSQHLDAEQARYLRTGSFRLRYLDYDWSLNELPAHP
jgi:hypothetical protein